MQIYVLIRSSHGSGNSSEFPGFSKKTNIFQTPLEMKIRKIFEKIKTSEIHLNMSYRENPYYYDSVIPIVMVDKVHYGISAPEFLELTMTFKNGIPTNTHKYVNSLTLL